MKPGKHLPALLYRPLLGLLLSLVAGSALLAWSLCQYRERQAEDQQRRAEQVRLQARLQALQAARPSIEAAIRLLDSLPKARPGQAAAPENHPRWQIESRAYRGEFRHEPALLAQINDWQNAAQTLSVLHRCHIRRTLQHIQADCAVAELTLLTDHSP